MVGGTSLRMGQSYNGKGHRQQRDTLLPSRSSPGVAEPHHISRGNAILPHVPGQTLMPDSIPISWTILAGGALAIFLVGLYRLARDLYDGKKEDS